MKLKKLLLVDDDRAFLDDLRLFLEPEYLCQSCTSLAEASKLMGQNRYHLILLDINLKEKKNGLDFLKEFRRSDPLTPVLMISRFDAAEKIVEAMKNGATDFLPKPVKYNELKIRLERILREAVLVRENLDLKDKLRRKEIPFFGSSPAIQQIKTTISRIADLSTPVLITGETGTGKEIVARHIHLRSKRKTYPFYLLNCSAIPENLIESELFGHEKGAFTGAISRLTGMFEKADKSTLLLDEIGDFQLFLQSKLLNVIESSEFYRLGGDKPLRTDVRLIFATNKNLNQMVGEHKFREDLLYRMNTLQIDIPPLRERKADIAEIADFYLTVFAQIQGKSKPTLTKGALAYLKQQGWPGNIRQLRNVLERVVIFSDSHLIEAEHFDLIPEKNGFFDPDIDFNKDYTSAKKAVLRKFQHAYFIAVLEKTNGNISQAAKIMGIARPSLQRLLKDIKKP